jgi:hypothetical protein
MQRAVFFIVLAASIVLSGTVTLADKSTQPMTACTSPGVWATDVGAHSAGVRIAVLADIDGFEARDMVAQVNETPPETNMTADHVVVLGARAIDTGAPQPYVLVAFFNRGCLVTAGRADPEAVAQMLSGSSI